MLITSNLAAPAWPQPNQAPAPVSKADPESTTSTANAAAAATVAGKGGPWNAATVGHTPIAGSSESARSAPSRPALTTGGASIATPSQATSHHDRTARPVKAEKETAGSHETPARQEQESSQKSAEQVQSRMAFDLQIKSISTQAGQTGAKAIADHTIVNQAVSAYMEFGPDRPQAKANKAA